MSARADDNGDGNAADELFKSAQPTSTVPRSIVNAEMVGDNESVLERLGPGAAFEVFRRCERVVEQLKLLDYEREFLPLNPAFKLFPRHYFARASNTGEQFFLFTSIAIWLARRAQIVDDVDMPHEFDDPNAVIANIIQAMKNAGFEIAFSPNKLKSGSGPYCVFVLQQLAKIALDRHNTKSIRVEVVANEQEPGEDGDGAAVVDDSGEDDEIEVTADQFNDDEYDVVVAADEDEDSTVNAFLPNDGNPANRQPTLKSIMNTFMDSNVMTAELRRVIPQLRITIRSEFKDWKMHVEQMDKYEKEIDANFQQSVHPFLAQNAREIGDAIERIASRETHINMQLDHLMHTFRLRQNEQADVSEKYRKSSGTLNSRTETLEALNEEVEQIKQQIEEQGVRNTNGTPILKIKQALAKMESSIFTMRVQIVVAEQALIQSQLADRLHLMTGGVRDPFA